MLVDVVPTISNAGFEPTVVVTAPVERTAVTDLISVTIDDRPLTETVNAQLQATDGPVAIIMADLALATPAAVDRLLSRSSDIVVTPGRGGGTNVLVVHPSVIG